MIDFALNGIFALVVFLALLGLVLVLFPQREVK